MLRISAAEFASRDEYARRFDGCLPSLQGEVDRATERRSGRRAARMAAALAAGTSPSRVVLGRTAAGAPRATVDSLPPESVHVSVTHRDGLAVAAADRRRRVGVDLERFGEVDASNGRYFLTELEAALPVPDPTTLWALKEAAWKALECDGSTPFHAVELQVDDAGELRAVAFGGRRHPAGASVLSPWPGYVLAVVWLEEEVS